VTVQTGLASKSDLTSVVTASGEIKPRNYINIGANAQGRITQLLVKEGDHVAKGQLLARIDETQSAAAMLETVFVQAAVKAKLIAPAVPNMAARHQRGPRNARTTATAMAALHAPPM